MKLDAVDGKPGLENIRKTKKSRKFKRTLLWLKFILIIALTAACAVLLALSPVFSVREIEVSGSKHYDAAEIISAAGIETGSNGFRNIGRDVKSILSLRFGNVEKYLLKAYPYIKEVKVRYIIPSKVRIELQERQPMALVPYLGTSLVIDGEGYVLDTVKNPEEMELPQVRGLKFESFELGRQLAVENPPDLDKVYKVMQAAADSDREDKFNLSRIINSIDVSDKNRLCLFVDSRLVVNFGDLKDINYRIRVLKQVMVKNLKKEDKGMLDFTAGENPVFMPDSGV